MRLSDVSLNEKGADIRMDMRAGFLKKIGPLGAAIILIVSALGLYMAFTADLGVPERYESLHSMEYYALSEDTMAQLLEELRENVFPRLDGILDSYLADGGKHIVIHTDRSNHDIVKAVILRDFDESLFEFTQ